MKKLLSIVLAGTLAASMVAVSATAVGAEETSSEKSPGGYGVAGEYTPSAGVQTKHLLFAMPNAWQNDTTKDPRCGGAAGLYWWTGYDTPDSKFGHGWPGWKAVKEEGKGADNLWGIDVPTYGNGETGNAMQIVWNNYLDGGTETDKTKNPFYDAAAQSNDSPAQYWSRTDDKALYDPLFRYIYKNVMVQENVEGAADLDLKSETFWVDANKLCAAALDADWEKLTAAERTYQVDNILDDAEVDYSEFGDYAENFFNEDLVGDEIYPNEESQGNGQAFTFDNMVYVVDFDVKKIQKNELSGKLGMGGDFYFYYGNGEYGTWPTKALAEQMGETVGNFTTGVYVTKTMEELMKEYEEYHKDDPTQPSSVSPTNTDATSSKSNTTTGSATNTSNGAVATGQVSMIAVVLVVLAAGIGIAVFTRKKEQK